MNPQQPEALTIIAGKGDYPLLLAKAARAQGIPRIAAVAFRGETNKAIARLVDDVRWVHVGALTAFLQALKSIGIPDAVMAGQITPTHLFRLRLDGAMLALLRRLPCRNAETIFGAVGDAMRAEGISLLPASSFMEAHMPLAGVLTHRTPTERESDDIALGMRIAHESSRLDVGQTVVVKEGTVLAVEAFEGTNAAIRRAATLGGKGIVVAKAAKPGHDMRFDIPVVGEDTLKLLAKVGASAIAIQESRAILLDQQKLADYADKHGICIVAVTAEAKGGAD